MAFGDPTRYIPISPGDISTAAAAGGWDQCVESANSVYSGRVHNICCDNCHSHVCCALNKARYMGFKRWNMVSLAFWVFFRGRFRSFPDVIKTFGPFTVLLLIAIFTMTKKG